MRDVHGYSMVTWDMCIRDWLCILKVGRLLLSCDAQPTMKSRYWLSCVRRGIPLRMPFGYRPLIGCIFDSSVGQDLVGRRVDFVYRNCIWISRKGVATQNGCLCREIGVFSHMSCEVELFYDHSGVKLTFWVFHSSIKYFESGCGRLLTVQDCGQVEYWRSVYTLVYSSVFVSWVVE